MDNTELAKLNQRPTLEELGAIARGRRELGRGETITLSGYLDKLASRTREQREKTVKSRSHH